MTKEELFSKIDLGETNFNGIDISEQNLNNCEIDGTYFTMKGVDFSKVNLKGAKISNLDLSYANFQEANLEKTTFENCIMVKNDFYRANCENIKFISCNLNGSNFISTNLKNSIFSGVFWNEVILAFTNLEGAFLGDIVNIDKCIFVPLPRKEQEKYGLIHAPIKINIKTIEHSILIQNNRKQSSTVATVEDFLNFFKKAGVSDILIEAYKNLRNKIDKNIQSIFISYSFKDQEFADKLYTELTAYGVEVWYAPKNMQGGKQIYKQIHSAIQSQDKVLLVLSENSMSSNWVKTEIEKAYKREAKEKQCVLFPLSITPFENIMNWEFFDSDYGIDLSKYIRSFYIKDFSDWGNLNSFKKTVEELVNDLKK